MKKEIQKELKEILAKKEITRQDARTLMIHLFNDSYFDLGEATNIHPMWLKEQFTAIKIFTKDSQERILQASFKRFQKKPKIKLKKD